MRFQLLNTDTQRAQAVQHALGIVGQQHIAYLGRALRQRGEQQNAIGNTLRAGQRDRARADTKGGRSINSE